MRLLYSLAIELVTWLVLVPATSLRMRLARRAKGAEGSSAAIVARDAVALRACLGDIEPSAPRDVPRLLIHAVSAGEMNAASAIVHELAERHWVITLSAGNDDALRIAEGIAARHDNVERIVRFPWDRDGGMQLWLEAIDPAVVAVMETEIWPNLFHACETRDTPLIIAGARLDVRAALGYRLTRLFFRGVLKCVSLVLATDEEQARRFLAIGAPPGRVVVCGNLKAETCAVLHPLASEGTRRPPGVVTVLAASTHDGEERLIVDAVREFGGVLLILAPRHVQRAGNVRLIASGVTVVDRMGELSSLYADADIVIIGGTFVRAGGHDLLEPAARGCALVAGPHLDNVQPLAGQLSDAGGLRITNDLAGTLRELCDDAATRQSLGDAARRFAIARRGSAALTADRIERMPRYMA
jgi:3-deoxy-D-manno-octulosonic-acid transferase